MTILYIALGLLAIGLIIFIHEAGHFLAAKKVGVRVDRFALGFDPVIKGRHLRFFCKTWGETEYVIGMIPFGGYVKLAGEIPEEGKPLADDELLAQSVGARAFVFVAGALMNFISAFIFFMIAFAIGVGFHEPRIGSVEIGSPAWEAGLRTNDKVLEIDDEPVVEYADILLASALPDAGTKLKMKVERPSLNGGDASTVEVEVTTKWNEARGFSTIGVGHVQGVEMHSDPDEGTAAHAAGLRKGDKFKGFEVDGVRLPRVPAPTVISILNQHWLIHPSKKVKIQVERASGEEEWLDFQLKRDTGAEKAKALRVLRSPGGNVVRAIAPGAALEDYLDPGDEIESINGEFFPIFDWVTLGSRFPDGAFRLSVRGPDSTVRPVEIPRTAFLRGIVLGEIHWGAHNARVGKLPEGATSDALQVDDFLTHVGKTSILEPGDIPKALEESTGDDVACVVLRDGKRTEVTVSGALLARSEAFGWRTFGPLAAVDAEGPAGKIGITAGCRIVKFGETEINKFLDLVGATKELEIDQKVTVAWLTPSLERKEAELTTGADAYIVRETGLALRFPEIIKRGNIAESFQLGIERSVIVVEQVFLTLRSLFRGGVSAKNLSGPVGITHLFTKVAEMGPIKLLFWMAVVSVNLGVLNLLPFPILDGGHLLFLLIEKIKGSPVSFGIQEWVTKVAFLLIISLALFVTYHDVARLF